MKLYLIFDETMGAYYCNNPFNKGWFNENYKQHCLIESKSEASKIMKLQAQGRRESNFQLLEVEMPESEYRQIEEELRKTIAVGKRGGHLVHDQKDIIKRIKAKKALSR